MPGGKPPLLPGIFNKSVQSNRYLKMLGFMIRYGEMIFVKIQKCSA